MKQIASRFFDNRQKHSAKFFRISQLILIAGFFSFALGEHKAAMAHSDSVSSDDGLLGNDVSPSDANAIDAILAGEGSGAKKNIIKPEKPDARITKLVLSSNGVGYATPNEINNALAQTGLESRVELKSTGGGTIELIPKNGLKYRYTVDGNLPTVKSAQYDRPITAEPGSVIKYVAVDANDQVGLLVGVILIADGHERQLGKDTMGYRIPTIAGPVTVRSRNGDKGILTEMILRGKVIWSSEGMNMVYASTKPLFVSSTGLQLWDFADMMAGNVCSSWGIRLVAFNDTGLYHMSWIPQCQGPEPKIQGNKSTGQLEIRFPGAKARRGSEPKSEEVLYSFDGHKVNLIKGKYSDVKDVVQDEEIYPKPVIKPGQKRDTIGAGGEAGSRSPESIAQVVRRSTGAMQSIYEQYLHNNPDLGGKISLKFTIAASGDVVKIDVVSSNTGNKDLDEQIKERASQMKFDQIESGSVTVTYAFALNRK